MDKKNIVTAVMVVLISAVFTTAVLYNNGYLTFGRTDRDPKAESGAFDIGIEESEESKEYQPKEGELKLSINTAPVFQSGTSVGNLRILNSEKNVYDMRVEIILADSGKNIYKTGLLKPGEHIEEDQLDTPLEAGEYVVIATFVAIDKTSGKDIGEAETTLLLTVLE